MKNLETQLNHPYPDDAKCPNKRCKNYGDRLECYFNYQNCRKYVRWDEAMKIYVRRVLLKNYLKNKK